MRTFGTRSSRAAKHDASGGCRLVVRGSVDRERVAEFEPGAGVDEARVRYEPRPAPSLSYQKERRFAFLHVKKVASLGIRHQGSHRMVHPFEGDRKSTRLNSSH